MIELYTLAPSHFCERARWALDHAKLPYVEKRLAPGLHMLTVRRLAPKTTLPIIRIEKTVIQGNDKILDWIGMPGADLEVEQRFETKIAPLVRRYAYAGLLNGPYANRLRDMLVEGIPFWQAQIAKLSWPFQRRMLISVLKARRQDIAKLENRLESELIWFENHLTKPYLVGESFGRADLTAASFLSPLLKPTVIQTYAKLHFPDQVNIALTRWNERPSLRWVRSIYERHRL